VNVLLLSMPDSFEHMPTVGIRMPNGALASLAGNVDPPHRVAVADLVLVQARVRETVERLVRQHRPDVVGLSVMTFQRRTALRLIRLVRALAPSVRIVAGGYDPSLAPEAYTDPAAGVDFVVRGEGELTFRALLRALEQGAGLDAIPGLSWRAGDAFRHNPERAVSDLDGGEIRPPDRCWAATPFSGGRWTWWRPRAAARSTAASAPSWRCAGATSTPSPSTASWPTSAMPAGTAPGRSSWSTTTSR
jgi:radical SAM superfamily enzyme YgiQ (UPF0313 family)